MDKLELTQRWLTSIIVRPGRLSDKIAAADSTYQLEMQQVLRSSELLDAESRIRVYAQGYVLRLMECMRADYPLLLRFLGEELFSTFAKAYLVSLPPHSPSLYNLGADFPGFLKASQPEKNTDRSFFDLPVELAYAERLWAEAEREKGLEQMPQALPDDPLFYFTAAGALAASPCLRLLPLEYELTGFVYALQKDAAAPMPAQRSNYAAICRKNYRVHMQELESWQYVYLQALQDADAGDAVKIATVKSGMTEEQIMAELLLWLPLAVDQGYLYIRSRAW